jgi:hypothetical protein
MKTIPAIIDGCRPGRLELVKTPKIYYIKNSAYTLNTSTIALPITLPVHFSIFTSLPLVGDTNLVNGK